MGRREDLLAEKQHQEDEQAAKQPFEFEKGEYTEISKDSISVFRFVGNTVFSRKDPWDPKEVLSSKIVDDNNKQCIIRWSKDEDWILNKIYKAVLAHSWDSEAVKDDGTKGKKVYKYVDKYPEMLKRVLHNGREGYNYNGKIIEDPGWRPFTSIYFNVINRDPKEYEWHKANKSLKLIAKKINYSEKSDGTKTQFPEVGIPNSLYNMLVNTVIEEHGDWETMDIAIKKLDKLPFYKIYSAEDERKISEEPHPKMLIGELTDEEKSWKRFDIDKLTPITSYKKIMNHLGSFIKEVDKNLETNFYSELKELVDKETEERKLKKLESSGDADESEDNQESPVEEQYTQAPIKVEEHKEEPIKRVRSAPSTDKFSGVDATTWKALDKLKDPNYAKFVHSISVNNIVYQDAFGNVVESTSPDIYECERCHADTYSEIPFCPKCGVSFN